MGTFGYERKEFNPIYSATAFTNECIILNLVITF